MKKRNLLTIFLISAVCLSVGAFAAGCNKKPPQPSGITLTVDESLQLETYESAKINSAVAGTNDKIIWSSSDESVVTVNDDGVVTAKGRGGEASVTAKVGDKSATCNVSVSVSPFAAVISLSETDVKMSVGEHYPVSVTSTWNGSAIPEAIGYSVSVAEGEATDVAAASYENGTVTVDALNGGNTTLLVSASVRGKLAVAPLNVTVYGAEAGYTVLPSADSFSLKDGYYEVDVDSSDLGGGVTQVQFDCKVYRADTEVEDAVFTWTSEESGIAQITAEGGGYLLQSLMAGSTVFTGSYLAEGGVNVQIKIRVNAVRPKISLDEHVVVDIESETPVTLKSELQGNVIDVIYRGESVLAANGANGKTVTLSKTNFPASAGLLGANREMTVRTDNVDYLISADVYSKVIRTKQDLQTVKNTVSALNGDGYYKLGGNIDAVGTWFTDGVDYRIGVDKPFVGTLDGDGYAIGGLIFSTWSNGGFIQNLGKKGTLKNIAFTDVALGGNTVFVYEGSGTIENVFVKYKAFPAGSGGSYNGNYASGINSTFGCRLTKNTFQMKNVVADFSAVSAEMAGCGNLTKQQYVKLFGTFSAGASIENTIAIGIPKAEFAEKTVSGTDAVRVIYSDNTDNGVSFSSTGWNETYWTVSGNTVVWKTKKVREK